MNSISEPSISDSINHTVGVGVGQPENKLTFEYKKFDHVENIELLLGNRGLHSMDYDEEKGVILNGFNRLLIVNEKKLWNGTIVGYTEKDKKLIAELQVENPMSHKQYLKGYDAKGYIKRHGRLKNEKIQNLLIQFKKNGKRKAQNSCGTFSPIR